MYRRGSDTAPDSRTVEAVNDHLRRLSLSAATAQEPRYQPAAQRRLSQRCNAVGAALLHNSLADDAATRAHQRMSATPGGSFHRQAAALKQGASRADSYARAARLSLALLALSDSGSSDDSAHGRHSPRLSAAVHQHGMGSKHSAWVGEVRAYSSSSSSSEDEEVRESQRTLSSLRFGYNTTGSGGSGGGVETGRVGQVPFPSLPSTAHSASPYHRASRRSSSTMKQLANDLADSPSGAAELFAEAAARTSWRPPTTLHSLDRPASASAGGGRGSETHRQPAQRQSQTHQSNRRHTAEEQYYLTREYDAPPPPPASRHRPHDGGDGRPFDGGGGGGAGWAGGGSGARRADRRQSAASSFEDADSDQFSSTDGSIYGSAGSIAESAAYSDFLPPGGRRTASAPAPASSVGGSSRGAPEKRFMRELQRASAKGELPPLGEEDGKDREVVRSWLAGLAGGLGGGGGGITLTSRKAGKRGGTGTTGSLHSQDWSVPARFGSDRAGSKGSSGTPSTSASSEGSDGEDGDDGEEGGRLMAPPPPRRTASAGKGRGLAVGGRRSARFEFDERAGSINAGGDSEGNEEDLSDEEDDRSYDDGMGVDV